jgi:hypothetical protein
MIIMPKITLFEGVTVDPELLKEDTTPVKEEGDDSSVGTSYSPSTKRITKITRNHKSEK